MKKEDKERIERITRKNEELCWETFERYAEARGVLMESRDMKQVLPRKLASKYKHTVDTAFRLVEDDVICIYGHEVHFRFSETHDFVLAYKLPIMRRLEKVYRFFYDARKCYTILRSIADFIPENVSFITEHHNEEYCAEFVKTKRMQNDCVNKEDAIAMVKKHSRAEDILTEPYEEDGFLHIDLHMTKGSITGRFMYLLVPFDSDMSFLRNSDKFQKVADDLNDILSHSIELGISLIPIENK